MWQPKSESELRVAISEGTFVESANLDFKAETGSTDGARKETAKDLASFAIDGGALLIGVAEDKETRNFSLAPVALNGLMEKIEQIAANRIDPPLHIRPYEIQTDDDPNAGYLFVEIPPSPQAPHMVSNIYYARGERTTRRLTDAEVVRFHGARRRDNLLVQELLAAEIARDPVPQRLRARGRLYLVAEPTSPKPGMARLIVRGDDKTAMFQLRRAAEILIPEELRIPPLPEDAYRWSLRARGKAFTTLTGGGRKLAHGQNEADMLDVEFEEDGGIRGTVGRLTDLGGDEAGRQVILDGLAVAYALRLVHWTRELSKRISYRGQWAFGIGATGLRDLASSSHLMRFPGMIKLDPSAERYDRDYYEAVTSAHLTELEDSPGMVAERLVGGLLRGLGSDQEFDRYFSGPDEHTAT